MPKPAAAKPAPKNSSALAILALLSILVIIVLGTYFAFVYYRNQAAEEVSLQETAANTQADQTASTTPETPVDPAADWLVFNLPAAAASSSAPSLAMSFKYPNTLQLTQNPGNIILSAESVSSTQVNIYWVRSGKSLKDYLSALDKLNAKGWEGQPSTAIVTSTDSIIISGWPAVFRQQKLLAADLNQYIAYIKASSTVYAISLAAPQLDQNMLAFYVTFLNNFKLGQ